MTQGTAKAAVLALNPLRDRRRVVLPGSTPLPGSTEGRASDARARNNAIRWEGCWFRQCACHCDPRVFHPQAAPRAIRGRGVLVLSEGGNAMFEGQPQTEIDALVKSDPEFKQLYQRHKLLNKKCMDAELGVLPIDDVTLGQMKREKLQAKEKLTRMYDQLTH
ncbi:hypothetical protein XHC_0632 [Xanthomonas hortorum pv. carotae str. M081]|nr:hypothetical protein XHC_0632 [Xanthomonas hortorum pv. carotae str. M081]